jgi:hypothetical protein
MEILVAEMQAIDILNGFPTHVTIPRQCDKLKENLEIVNINRSEYGVDQFNVEFICDLANGIVPLTSAASRHRSSSDDSVNSDNTIFGAKSRPPSRKRESTKSNQTESINYSESDYEDDDLNSEERFTTSHASYPTIDITIIGMS